MSSGYTAGRSVVSTPLPCKSTQNNTTDTHQRPRLEKSAILSTRKKLIGSVSAVDDDDPSVSEPHLEHGSVRFAPCVVSMCGVASALEEAPNDGPPTGTGQGGFGCEGGCGPGDDDDEGEYDEDSGEEGAQRRR